MTSATMTVDQALQALQTAVAREQAQAIQARVTAILNGHAPAVARPSGRRPLSAAARARISKAAKAYWRERRLRSGR